MTKLAVAADAILKFVAGVERFIDGNTFVT